MEENRAADAPRTRPHVELRPITANDREFLLRVYYSTRADELALVPWNDEQKWAFARQQSDAQQREYHSRFPDAQYDVILCDGEPAGRFWVGRDEEEIRLLDIAVLPEYQNRGIGTVLLRKLSEEGAREGKRLRHMVFKFNTEAMRFYERLGFRQIEDVGMYIHLELVPHAARAQATASDD
jgi:ribosomal protein S18 acetylase RimI-like enzyme